MTRIEGASAEQRMILEEILDGLEGTGLEAVSIEAVEEEWGAEEGEVAVRATHRGEPRTHWHAMLVAGAFARRLELEGLPTAAVLIQPDGASGIHARAIDLEPPSERDGVVLESLARAAGGSLLTSLAIRRPYGYAAELTLQVDEPHSFLRSVMGGLIAPFAAPAWEGFYVEILDRGGETGWLRGCSSRSTSCISRTRRDLECCGWQGLGHPVEWAPPVCPVFDRLLS